MIIYEYWVGIGVGKGVWASYTSINSLEGLDVGTGSRIAECDGGLEETD